MRKIYRRTNKCIVYSLIIFIIISLSSIISASTLINNNSLVFKQIIWYMIGFYIIYLINNIDDDYIFNNYKILYILGNILLLSLLIFATPINNSKCWFSIGNISIQPSEFVKIILIITNAMIIDKSNKNIFLIIKIILLTIIPCILIFLEPDTGMIIIYFIISFIMLYTSGIDKKYFILFILILSLLLSIFLSLYFYKSNTFINLFGSNFFYRIDRLLDWKNGSGMQLSNALIGIGSAFVFGFGFNNTPIYFPEPQTDFIFSVFAINYGFIGVIILLLTILIFDINIIKIGIKSKNNIDKYIISGISASLIYQQIQNIGMNIGLLPITGITLPFISYGGSSLISYMIMLGIIIKIDKKSK